MEVIAILESIIAQDYITVFDNDGNTHAITKKAFIQIVKENI
jgi:hypothetical protein